MKILFIVSSIFLLLSALGLWLALTQIAPWGIILMNKYTNEQLKERLQNKTKPEDFLLTAHNMQIVTRDKIELNGWYLPAKDARATVIVLHGINANRLFMLPIASELVHNGFNVAVFDLRGHGQSSGKYCTYGFYEKQDIIEIVNALIKKDSNVKIGIYGNSMGGAIALQAMACDSRIKCGVVESTFANLRQIVSAYMKRIYFFGPQFLSDIALNKAARIANFDPDSVQPEISAQKINNPVFIAHGDMDIHVDISNAQRIFNNVECKDKILYTVKGAGHHNLLQIGGIEYKKKLIDFLHAHLQ
jgi:alpha-beta hydrolase superfamily lysophospholipase